MIADVWSRGFQPVWQTTPSWLIIAACAVLGLRYSRGLELDAIERGHLQDWHRDMHGASAGVPGLTPAKQTLFAVYHPGWAWCERVFQKSPGLRGVLGFWYRSPSKPDHFWESSDVDIIDSFTTKLHEGESFLGAWQASNEPYFGLAQYAWAAMVRDGCQGDTLATLESANLSAATGAFKYYDRFQRGRTVIAAYDYANRLNEVSSVGGVTLRHNANYDGFAVEELQGLSVSPSAANFLNYTDGIGP
jgi:hypothetical protein